MATITWLNKIDGFDLGDPQKNVNAADMNQIKSAVNTNDSETTAALALKAPKDSPTFTGTVSGISPTMVGLGNVNNTSDVDKPISTDQQAAFDLKAPIASPTFTGTVSGITKTMVGLGNVDNTADTAKPVSTAQQTALDLKLTKSDFVWSEIPSGTINGINDTFTIANSNPSQKAVYSDGIRTNPSNFSITGTTLTITNAAVIPTNSLLIDYIK